jgi:hypothetical protein
MTMSTGCQACGRLIRVKDELAGKRVRCPYCREIQFVGSGGSTAAARSPVPEVEQKIAPMAYAAMFSAVPILFMPCLFIFPLTFGYLALRDIERNPWYVGAGRAKFGIIWGYIGLFLPVMYVLLVVMILVFARRR